ncbi:MAG: fatty acid desaturase [Roseomonas sp.]|nr:fatty acid desaturase [Roseomonas sp.]
MGIRQRALATVLHEATHWTLARSQSLCAVLGSIAGWCIFQTFASYRQSHCKEHHPFLGSTQKDPDLANYDRQRLFEQPPQSFLRQHLIEAARGGKIAANICNLIRDRLLVDDIGSLTTWARVEYVGFALFWVLLICVVAMTGAWLPLILWLTAYLTVFQTLNWLIELCEHFPIIRTGKNELEMTRNREGHWVEDFITGVHGEKWHLVHHLQPGIPFWLLHDAHRVMLADAAYAAANEGNSGVFTSGPDGRPSILTRMRDQLAAYQRENA